MRPGLSLLIVVGLSLLFGEDLSLGQHVVRDYWINVPRHYGPRDPWEVGLVMRHQAGWGGHFYNCDCEEHKRLSPYIRWEQQPTVCCPHCHCWDIKQQINEIKQRVRTGSCQQCKFCVCPRCCTSEPPIPSTCPDGYGQNCGCPNCAAAPQVQPTIQPAPGVEEAPAPQIEPPIQPPPRAEEPPSTGWLRDLYKNR